MKVKIGDKVRLAYISDISPYSGKIGIVVAEGLYKYHPNGEVDEFEWRQWCKVEYFDGGTYEVEHTERKGSGIVSPLEIIE